MIPAFLVRLLHDNDRIYSNVLTQSRVEKLVSLGRAKSYNLS